MDIYCITIYNKFESQSQDDNIRAGSHFYFSQYSWEAMGEKIEWALDMPKPYLSINHDDFSKFVNTCIDERLNIIIPDYFTGKQSIGRLIIEKNICYAEK